MKWQRQNSHKTRSIPQVRYTRVENIIIFFLLHFLYHQKKNLVPRIYLVEMVKMIDGFSDSILLAFMDDI